MHTLKRDIVLNYEIQGDHTRQELVRTGPMAIL
jgi:hypothetical protein